MVRNHLIVWGLILGMLLVGVSPFIRHALDGGHQEVTLSALVGDGWPGTRNLTIRGAHADFDRAVSGQGTVYAPLVVDSAGDSGVRVVLSCQRERVAKLRAADGYRGVVRDIWWEGLDEKQKAALARAGVSLTSDARLFDVDEPVDALAASAMLGFVIVFGGLSTLWTFFKRRRRSTP